MAYELSILCDVVQFWRHVLSISFATEISKSPSLIGLEIELMLSLSGQLSTLQISFGAKAIHDYW